MKNEGQMNVYQMLHLRKSVELEADQLASKIIKKVAQNYPAKTRDASFGGNQSERRTIKTLEATSNERFIPEKSHKYYLPKKGDNRNSQPDLIAGTKSSDNILLKNFNEDHRFTYKKSENYFVPNYKMTEYQKQNSNSHQVKSPEVQEIISKINNLSKILEKNSNMNKLTNRTLKSTIMEVNTLKNLFQLNDIKQS